MVAGRERPRAYFGLLLLLEVGARAALHRPGSGAVLRRVGSDDDPAVLVMVRCGAARVGAGDHPFVVYTSSGRCSCWSRSPARRSAHTFEVSQVAQLGRVDLALLGLRARVLHQGAALPAARLAAGRVSRVDAGDDRAAFGRDLEGRRLRPAALLPCRSSRALPTTGAGSSSGLGLVGLLYGPLVAFRQPDARGVVAYSSLAGADEPDHHRDLRAEHERVTGAIFQMVNHGSSRWPRSC